MYLPDLSLFGNEPEVTPTPYFHHNRSSGELIDILEDTIGIILFYYLCLSILTILVLLE